MLETGPHVPVHYLAAEARTLPDLFRLRARRSGPRPAMYRKRAGAWSKITWTEFHDAAARGAAALVELGLAPGDRVAILGPTQPEWAMFDMAAQLAGLVSFGIYSNQTEEQLRYLLDHSEAKVALVSASDELDKVLRAARDNPHLVAIVPWEPEVYQGAAHRDPRVLPPERMASSPPLSDHALDERLAAVDPDDTAILIYTSGTTGPPKGAMISHRNILSLLEHQARFLDLYEDDISLSFLPMAHAAERVMAFYSRINAGMPTAYASTIGAVLTELAEVQPTVFGSVPRIFEKAYAKIRSELSRKPKAVQRLFAWAEQVGRQRVRLLHAGRPVPKRLALQHAVADALVFKKMRQAFGGRVRLFVTGAAPIGLDILELFWAAGLPIYEAFGMTEATVATHINRPGAVRLGTVGQVIAPMEHRVAEDGEVLLRGPWVFKGYFKDPEATAQALEGGWLHTGDIGSVDADGFLRITDRKKHLIITAGGKNLTPANIEKAIKAQDTLISHVHAHGDRRPFVVALIAPSPLETLEWGRDRGLVTQDELDARTAELMADPSSRTPELEASMAKVTTHPDFHARITQAVRRGNATLAQVERVKRFVILDRDLSQGRGELTPTMKVKRKELETRFQATFDRMYDEAGFALEAA